MNYSKKYEYDISILIPIFNAEHFIEDTINSVLNQNTHNVEFEIILLDDGSTDGSSNFLEEVASKYDFISYYSHQNSGVSYTRNRGISLAKGKYILFLDADDFIGEDTLKSVFFGFEKYEKDADILVYPLYQKNGDKINAHVRNKAFTKKGDVNVYDISEYPFLNQCTMNVVIKNDDYTQFNERLVYGEDALFNTNYILKNRKVIHIKEGGYFYNIGHNSAVDKNKNPVDIQDDLLILFENLIETALNISSEVPVYVQGIILYELNWRFKQSTLFPNHLDSEAYQKWFERMKKIFGYISVDTILAKPLMDYYHKLYFIKTFKGNIKYNQNLTSLNFVAENQQIAMLNKALLVFNKIKIIGQELKLSGYIKAPLLDMVNTVSLVLKDKHNHEKIIPIYNSSANYYKTRMSVAQFYDFSFSIPVDEVNNYEFVVNIDGKKLLTNHWFTRNVIFKTTLNSKDIVTKDKIISYTDNPFKIHIKKKSAQIERRILKNHNLKMKLKNQNGLKRFQQFKKFFEPYLKRKRIWLYNDRIGVLDNGYRQFIHDVNKNDGIERYYVVREDDLKKEGFPKENVVVYGSLKHKMLFYYAELILTSFKEHTEFSPLSFRAYDLFFAEFKFQIVYLQHGVLNAHTPWLYGKHVTSFDKFVISSEYEKNNLLHNYGYNEDDLLVTGMPRLDDITVSKKCNKILIAPSWRKALTKEENRQIKVIDKDTLEQSNFFTGIHKLINSDELNNILQQNNYELDIKMHPIFANESSLFQTEKSNINVLDSTDEFNISEYKLFVTDFSSYMFDFIKSRTRIEFYFPDYKYFLSGNHIYNKLDFDVSKFGNLNTESYQLINFIKEEIKNDFQLTQKQEEIYEDFYVSFDTTSHKDVLYKELIKVVENNSKSVN